MNSEIEDIASTASMAQSGHVHEDPEIATGPHGHLGASGVHHMPEHMMMYFHFGLGDQLLFKSLTIDSNLKLWLACLVLFALAVILEAINFVRRVRCRCQLRPPFVRARFAKLANHDHNAGNGQPGVLAAGGGAGSCCRNEQSGGQTQVGCRDSTESGEAQLCCNRDDPDASGGLRAHCMLGLIRHDKTSYRLIQTALHVVGTALALTLMLAAMTYNVCLIFAIVLGAGVGFMLFNRQDITMVPGETLVCH